MRNRTPLIRIPASHADRTRIELRSPDPSCNPYLALAVCLAAGLDGIRNRILPPEHIEQNLYDLSPEELRAANVESLPRNLKEAVEEFEKDELMQRVLGAEACRKYADTKRKEWEAYNAEVSQWELDHYLLRI
jgi:glutamine synthetase